MDEPGLRAAQANTLLVRTRAYVDYLQREGATSQDIPGLARAIASLPELRNDPEVVRPLVMAALAHPELAKDTTFLHRVLEIVPASMLNESATQMLLRPLAK
jgi:hypothetical protein